MADLTKVKLERASDAVFHILRESILDQTFLPGQRLNVKDLAERLDVSPTPIKDAITRLVMEGLIEVRPRSGTYVTQISTQDIAETLAVRRALELLAAETAVHNVTEEEVESLEELLRSMEDLVMDEQGRQSHERKNFEFHQRLVEISGNRRMLEMYRGLNAHIKMARVHYTSEHWEARLQNEQQEHRSILAGLKARKVHELQKALNEHIRRASDALVRDLEKSAAKQGKE